MATTSPEPRTPLEAGPEWLEKYSSAITLSDMEVFVFPELLYSLVLANIMSPRLWAWREDPWFSRLERLSPYRRIMRLKQYIMDHYDFNLDLETWGLTHKQRELDRFRPFISPEVIAESNALFGYEGDRYYFDLDIRRHFGLDKYDSDIIPYWKTETLEAMDAFRFKPDYERGAGECVSLSTLYAAALFVVCGVPLEDIFLMTTPLHSQNFVDVGEGLITNNRRVLTKTMWFNGSELSMKAQRALRHEKVTIVAHCSGYIHQVYEEATIDPAELKRFSEKLSCFLRARIDEGVVINFLRANPQYQQCFQLSIKRHGKTLFIPVELAFHYEHGGPYRLNDHTRSKVLEQIDESECYATPIPDRMILEEFERFFHKKHFAPEDKSRIADLIQEAGCHHPRAHEVAEALMNFTVIEPRLPAAETKRFVRIPGISLTTDMNREAIIGTLEQAREKCAVADLAFYAYRDLSRCDWLPFLKAAVERNPVIIEGVKEYDDADFLGLLQRLPSDSIYDGPRLAQPDEVWNFGRGDGVEKALAAADVLHHRHPEKEIRIIVKPDEAVVRADRIHVSFPSVKGLAAELTVYGSEMSAAAAQQKP